MRKALWIGVPVVVVVAIAVSVVAWWNDASRPTEAGDPFFHRFESATSLEGAIETMVELGVIRDARAAAWVARGMDLPASVEGTFEFQPGLELRDALAALDGPVSRMVRIPEGRWIARVAALLEEEGVCPAEEYVALANQPEEFADVVNFELPKESLEGYLYPDTYDLPPLLGCRGVIERQLQAFQSKVADNVGPDQDLKRAVIVGSMVELEAALDPERPKIAGVIENRLAIDMRLQIDATLLYQIQEWRTLTFADYREIEGPYSTYKNRGLPPGPICSPSWKSVEGALNPDEHEYLYYVARPNLEHLFSRTYDEHRENIRRARAERDAAETS